MNALNVVLLDQNDAPSSSEGMFAFGQFDNLYDGKANYSVYELPLFIAMGCVGGVLGAGFNDINERMSLYRKKYLNAYYFHRQ